MFCFTGSGAGAQREKRELNCDIATVLDELKTVISEISAHESIIEYLPDSGEEFTAMS